MSKLRRLSLTAVIILCGLSGSYSQNSTSLKTSDSNPIEPSTIKVSPSIHSSSSQVSGATITTTIAASVVIPTATSSPTPIPSHNTIAAANTASSVVQATTLDAISSQNPTPSTTNPLITQSPITGTTSSTPSAITSTITSNVIIRTTNINIASSAALPVSTVSPLDSNSNRNNNLLASNVTSSTSNFGFLPTQSTLLDQNLGSLSDNPISNNNVNQETNEAASSSTIPVENSQTIEVTTSDSNPVTDSNQNRNTGSTNTHAVDNNKSSTSSQSNTNSNSDNSGSDSSNVLQIGSNLSVEQSKDNPSASDSKPSATSLNLSSSFSSSENENGKNNNAGTTSSSSDPQNALNVDNTSGSNSSHSSSKNPYIYVGVASALIGVGLIGGLVYYKRRRRVIVAGDPDRKSRSQYFWSRQSQIQGKVIESGRWSIFRPKFLSQRMSTLNSNSPSLPQVQNSQFDNIHENQSTISSPILPELSTYSVINIGNDGPYQTQVQNTFEYFDSEIPVEISNQHASVYSNLDNSSSDSTSSYILPPVPAILNKNHFPFSDEKMGQYQDFMETGSVQSFYSYETIDPANEKSIFASNQKDESLYLNGVPLSMYYKNES